MADKKISALPAATTPLAGTEVLPIVQGGTTDQVSVANLTVGRDIGTKAITTTGNVGVKCTPLSITPLQVSLGTDRRLSTFLNGSDNVLGFLTDAGNWTSTFYTGTPAIFGSGAAEAFRIDTNQNIVIKTAAKGIDFSANANAPGMTSELLNWYEEGTWTGTLTAATPPTVPVTATGRYTRIGNQITVAIEFDNVDTTGASGAMEVTGLPFAAVSAGYGPVMKSGIGTQVIMAGIYGGLSKVIFSDAGTMSTTSIVAGAGVYLRFSATYFM
jgi:hypothetical protein